MLSSNTEGLEALHLLLVKARFRAFEHQPASDIGRILDVAETLVTHILSDEDRTQMFRSQLQDLGERFPDFAGIASNYESLRCADVER